MRRYYMLLDPHYLYFPFYGYFYIQQIPMPKISSFSEIPQFKDSYLIASQGMALMKVPFNATRYNPGVPIYMQASMTASSLDIDCIKKKVSK